MHTWQLQEAKARLSTVVEESITHGPQQITLRGKPTAIVLSVEDYEKLANPKPSFLQFMRQSPLVGVKLQLKRNRSLTREVSL